MGLLCFIKIKLRNLKLKLKWDMPHVTRTVFRSEMVNSNFIVIK